MSKLIEHVEKSLEMTNKNVSKITPEIFNIPGMTGLKTKFFYNNICSMNDTRYLEIGSYQGSSICSAMCNNNIKYGIAIDNWSEFDSTTNKFMPNFKKFRGNNNVDFIEKNCWEVDTNSIGKFNIYMYDGAHDHKAHYEALNYYLNCLDNEFIYLVDDWNGGSVKTGTFQAIEDLKLEVLYKKEIFSTLPKGTWGDSQGWWNGIGIFVLRKTQ